MLTRKDFIQKANEFIEQLKDKNNVEYVVIDNIVNYCKIAKNSNPRFDEIRFRDWIERGLYE